MVSPDVKCVSPEAEHDCGDICAIDFHLKKGFLLTGELSSDF